MTLREREQMLFLKSCRRNAPILAFERGMRRLTASGSAILRRIMWADSLWQEYGAAWREARVSEGLTKEQAEHLWATTARST